MMNTNDIRNFVKNSAANSFINAFENCIAIADKDYVYAIPVEVDGVGTVYAKFTMSTCQWTDTKTNSAFDPETDGVDPVEALDEIRAKQEEKRTEREAKAKKA